MSRLFGNEGLLYRHDPPDHPCPGSGRPLFAPPVNFSSMATSASVDGMPPAGQVGDPGVLNANARPLEHTTSRPMQGRSQGFEKGVRPNIFIGSLLVPSQIQLGGLGELCKLPPAGSGAEPQTLTNLVHFRLKRKHLVLYISLVSEYI